jgi:hypothetical protein
VPPMSVMLALTQRSAAASVIGEPHTPWPVDEDSWLRHCEGFQVDADGKRLGVVECVGYRSQTDLPDIVMVRSGCLHLRIAVVAVRDVVEVRPAERRLVVRRRTAADRVPGRAQVPRYPPFEADTIHDRKDAHS